MERMEPLEPTLTQALFRPLHRELTTLLRGLAPADWHCRCTRAWLVSDVAAHILDGDLRRLSIARDEHGFGPSGDFAEWINRINGEWVTAFQRISPEVLCGLLEWSGPRVADYFESLDPMGEAKFPVSWAGETRSRNWMDIGRDYTEKWHHQQQIRDAVGAPALTSPEWLRPAIEVFLRALPGCYAETEFGEVAIEVTGGAGGVYTVTPGGMYRGEQTPECRIVTGQDTLWRMMTKGIGGAEAQARSRVSGRSELSEAFFGAIAIVG